VIDISESIEACAQHYGEQADAMRSYLLEGQASALALPNRGPAEIHRVGHADGRDTSGLFGIWLLRF